MLMSSYPLRSSTKKCWKVRRASWAGVGLVAWLLLFGASAGCAAGPPAEDVARQIERMRGQESVGGEHLLEPAAIDKFYRARDSRPAWLDHADDIVKTIHGMSADGLDPAHYHLEAIEGRIGKSAPEPTAESAAVLDELLADAVAAMADDVHYGRVRPSQVNPAWNVDPRDNASPLDSTLAA